MLAKLLKYELKATSRIFLPLYAVLILFAIITKIFFIINNNSTAMQLIAGLGTVAYVFTIVIIFVLTLIVMIQRFYKNLLCDEGYLMFTLPTSTWMQIACKLIVSMIWQIVSLILTAASVFILAFNQNIWNVICSGISQACNDLNRFGLNPGVLLAEIFVLFIISLISSILMIYASITVGHLFSRHKILASFGAYLALNMVEQTISSVIVVIVTAVNPQFMTNPTMNATYIHILLIGIMILSLIFSVGYYIVTEYILKKHLNLE